MASERVHVICFGNELHGDDGFGPAVHAHLAAAPLPAHVRLLRADIAGLAAINCFEGCARAIVVDALSGFGPAGSLHALAPADFAADAARAEALAGFHGAGLGALLALLPAALERLPQILLIGVEAARVAPFSPGLSASVAARIGEAAAHIRKAWL